MPDICLFRFFWGVRREAASACADRVRELFGHLRRIDREFRIPWYDYGLVLRKPEKAIPLESRSQIIRLFESGINHSDVGRKPIPALGYTAEFSAAEVTDAYVNHIATLRVQCGCYCEAIQNSLMFEISGKTPLGIRVCNPRTLIRILSQIVKTWQPDVGQVGWSPELSDAINESGDGIQVGWLTYIAKSFATPPWNDCQFETRAVGKFGRVVIATNEVFSIKKAKHITAVRQISSFLNSARGRNQVN
jgi:hypothetical protein